MFINDIFKGRRDARQGEAAAKYEAAIQGLQQAGIDPFSIYSPDNINEMLYTPEGMATLAGLYPGDINMALESGQVNPSDIAQELAFGLISDYMRNPQTVVDRFGKPSAQAPATATTPAGNSLAPVDYVKDVLSLPGQIWEDPSSIFSVIFGPGGVTGNVDWGDRTIDRSQLPGATEVIDLGKYGKKEVSVGATTGIPAVDEAIRRVLGQSTGPINESVYGVLIGEVERATGFPVETVIGVLSNVFKDPTARTTTTGSTTSTVTGGQGTDTTAGGQGTDTTIGGDGTDKVTVGTGPTLSEQIREWLRKNKGATDKEIRKAAETYGVSPEDIAEATGVSVEEVNRRWQDANKREDTPQEPEPPPPPPQGCSDPVYAAQNPEECYGTPPPPPPPPPPPVGCEDKV
jgi:Ca2+-binding RTX toxin-like protein